MAEVAGAEPPVAEGRSIGLRVVVVAGEDGRADHADLAGLVGRELPPLVVLDRDLHAGAGEAAGPDPGLRSVLRVVQGGRQDGDVAGDLP